MPVGSFLCTVLIFVNAEVVRVHNRIFVSGQLTPVLNSPKSSVIDPVSTPPPNILSSCAEPVVRLIIDLLFSFTSSPDLNWFPLQT